MSVRTGLAAAAILAAVLSGCGGETRQAPAGSAQNPLVGRPSKLSTATRANEASAPGTPSSDGTAGTQRACDLVTAKEARAIFGKPIRRPLEAAQGPTCIYRPRHGSAFTSVALQSVDFPVLKRHLLQARRVTVAGHSAYCGFYGQPMLYVPLPGTRVLSVAGSCSVGKRFAQAALPRVVS